MGKESETQRPTSPAHQNTAPKSGQDRITSIINSLNAYIPPPLNAKQKRILIKSLIRTKNLTKLEIQNIRSDSTPKSMRFHYYPASIMNITHHFSPICLQEINETFDTPTALGEKGKSTHQLWYIPIKLQNMHADTQLALIDTGCTHTCMSEENWLQTDREDCAFSTCRRGSKRNLSNDNSKNSRPSYHPRISTGLVLNSRTLLFPLIKCTKQIVLFIFL